jgi:hypothetical protein
VRLRALLIGSAAVLLAFSLRELTAVSASSNVSAMRAPVLVELFTSEGCSDCPPADSLLEKLDQAQPVPTADVIVLSEHVDYWDDTGWRDPYSSHQFSIRQADYASHFGLNGPYTPQMVVDGNTEFVGSNERQAIQAIEGATHVAKLPVSLSSLELEAPNSVTLHIEVGPSSSTAKPLSGRVFIALADASDQSSVRGGENSGRTLKHVAVVRTLAQVGTLDRSGAFSKDVKVNAGSANLHNLRVVAFVQGATLGRVIGVASARLSQ